MRLGGSKRKFQVVPKLPLDLWPSTYTHAASANSWSGCSATSYSNVCLYRQHERSNLRNAIERVFEDIDLGRPALAKLGKAFAILVSLMCQSRSTSAGRAARPPWRLQTFEAPYPSGQPARAMFCRPLARAYRRALRPRGGSRLLEIHLRSVRYQASRQKSRRGPLTTSARDAPIENLPVLRGYTRDAPQGKSWDRERTHRRPVLRRRCSASTSASSSPASMSASAEWIYDSLYTPRTSFWQLVMGRRGGASFSCAPSSNLKTIASAVLLDRQPFDRIVRWRTVAKVLSM